jgi:hypothetical protein
MKSCRPESDSIIRSECQSNLWLECAWAHTLRASLCGTLVVSEFASTIVHMEKPSQPTPSSLSKSSFRKAGAPSMTPHDHRDIVCATPKPRTQMQLCRFQDTGEQSGTISSAPTVRPNLDDVDIFPLAEQHDRMSARRTKLRRALALEDMMARVSINGNEHQEEQYERTTYGRLHWESLDTCDNSSQERDGEKPSHNKPREPSRKIDPKPKGHQVEAEFPAASAMIGRKTVVRPAQAKSLLKKTLRSV